MYCSDCGIAVVVARFDDDLKGITITFPFPVSAKNQAIQKTMNESLTSNCRYFFSDLEKFGLIPQCK